MAVDDAGAPRRQDRGRRRIEQILHAAAAVFAEQGYEGATTNAIAAEAGISPGSLYQYFRNKDDIAHALAEHYADQLQALRSDVLSVEAASPDEVVDQVLGPLVEFNAAHPGFKSLFARTDMPDTLRTAVAPVHDAIHARVSQVIDRAVPGQSTAELARTTTVAIQIVRSMMPLITAEKGEERDALVAELARVLVSYLNDRKSM